ncbi:hypothetical protein COCSADRAFT_357055 [Bipolaris sorokiniana ND90Pr]|uniref:Uncharacterized protein n=1 Tax=Cochliobolus sativus (strain ND90Pr / ATCC 201652) TaxID=665912 RepID=M2T587_COCSN|nr:uncharacterized protein COCSADRAFT_357055 [Bipolaris sorokiniana ND90Pr]EMD64147.1 hypothetical protein COCSADRAFT_357055 [Bipolaris sorokiniana ND90Pr]
MDFSCIESHFRTPQLGFQVFHYSNDISNPHTLPLAYNIGVFDSLEQAQDAAQSELARVLKFHLNQGHSGRCFREMNLSLRGLITAYVDSLNKARQSIRRELILSEFHIVKFDAWDPSRAVHESNVQAHELSMYKLSSEIDPPFVQHDEERSPEWARSRIPLFVRRDEGPLRRPGDQPYTVRMGFLPPKPIPAIRSISEQSVKNSDSELLRRNSV